ncbi:hypothetical protein [Amycolatopsis sp. NPDC051371]
MSEIIEQQAQGVGGLLGHDAVAEGAQLGGAGQVEMFGGDPARR